MKILNNNNFKKLKLLIETYNDLWVLTEIIEPNDIIIGEIDRKIKIGTSENYKVTRKKFNVVLKTIKVEIESETLIISGIIENENEFISKGSNQSIRLQINDQFSLEKTFLKFQKKILNNAVKSSKSKNLLILVDNNTLVISEFTDKNYRIITEENNLGNKKRYKEQKSVDDIENKFNIIKDYLKKDYDNIILSGPGFWKNSLEEITKKELNKKTLLYQWNEVSNNTIPKLIKNMEQDGFIKESSLSEESKIVDELKLNISKKNNKYSYGLENVTNTAYAGAIETLLISSKYLKECKEKGEYENLKELIITVEKSNSKVIIINSKHESGQILDGLGGIAGILRYSI